MGGRALICCALAWSTAPAAAAPDYAGSDSCRTCHADQFAQWRGSHHQLAMQAATDDAVLGDFSGAEFSYFEATSRFFKRDGQFLVHTDGPGGRFSDFALPYTFGVYPLQQYLVPLPGGRLQALGIAWDARPQAEGGQRWFHLYPNRPVTHQDPLHWSKPQQNWNHMCAECHATGVRKNFDPLTDTFDTRWSEIGVGCEACHGPGAQHIAWAEGQASLAPSSSKGLALALGAPHTWEMDPDSGIAARDPPAPAGTEVPMCARCHARRSTLSEDPVHGQPLLDTHLPVVLSEGLYHADGQIDDEVYVYGSFLQSRMFRRGVTCSDCHDPHSAALRAAGNALCARCHLPARFDTERHHFHKLGGAGASCTGCHMPKKTYMRVDPRADHSFRIPRPALSLRLGTPNACMQCHRDRSDAWAAEAVAAWYGAEQPQAPHFATALHAGRTGSLQAEALLVALARDADQPDIARASSAALLSRYLSPLSIPTAALLLRDPDPLVRVSALQSLQRLPAADRLTLAAHLLRDPVRAVRIEAAQVLSDAGAHMVDADTAAALTAAVEEFLGVQALHADRAEAQFNRGNLLRRLQRFEEAEAAYRSAMRLDPQFVPGVANLVDLLRERGRDTEAEPILQTALAAQPDAATLEHSYGLLLVRLGRPAEARGRLARAAQLAPDNTRFQYTYAVALHSAGRTVDALRVLQHAQRRYPADRDVLYALVHFNLQAGRVDAARHYLAVLLEASPWDQNAHALQARLPHGAPREPSP